MSTPRFLAVVVVLATVAAAADDSLDDRIAKGEVVVEQSPVAGFSQPATRTFAVLEAPPEQVFALVDDCAHYAGLMPRTTSSAETARDGGASTCSWVIDLPFPMKDVSTEVVATSRREAGRWTREFKQTDGGFLRNEGQWTLTPFRGDPGRTRVDYRLFIAMDTVLPDAFVKAGQRGGMEDMVKNLRARVVKR